MPEAPEVSVISENLDALLQGQTISGVKILGGRFAKKEPVGFSSFVKTLPLRVTGVKSKGKFMYIGLENNKYIFNTLGLTGEWSFERTKHSAIEFTVKISNRKAFPNKNTSAGPWTTNRKIEPGCKFAIGDHFISPSGVKLPLDAAEQYYDPIYALIPPDGLICKAKEFKLYFTDQMHYGCFHFNMTSGELIKKLKTLGPDILKDNITSEQFNAILNKKAVANKKVVDAIMNQKNISGVGNYLAAESLYCAKINPHRWVGTLSKTKRDQLLLCIRYLAKLAYLSEYGIYNYVPQIRIRKGARYSFKVYRQKYDPHGNPVKADVIIKGRTTYWSPAKQK